MSEVVMMRIRLFGSFREYGEGELLVEVPRGCTVAELRGRIRREFEAAGSARFALLAGVSALGSDTEILAETDRVEDGAALALLPPVCGGRGGE